MSSEAALTRRLTTGPASDRRVHVPRFSMKVLSGAEAGLSVRAVGGRVVVGTSEGTNLRLSDPAVSRFHFEVETTAAGLVLRDLGSTNGTRVRQLLVREALIEGSVEIEIGSARIALEVEDESEKIDLSPADRFGDLLGHSPPMREIFAALERAAPTNAPILITGESGTGKELAANAIHQLSPRRDQPFETLNCGGLPATLIESELFGFMKGSFTGAHADHQGAFERANGGTLFLDELGELPLELQPKLLRALGEHEIRRIGAKHAQAIDVRVIAATNRDLRREANVGRFRSDLFFRLAVIQVHMPPLRERLEDLPLICARLLDLIESERGIPARGLELPAELWEHDWPGNVRELRNYLEQMVILRTPPKLGDDEAGSQAIDAGLDDLPMTVAKATLIERFETQYLSRLLEKTGGNVAEAARRSGVNRATLFRTMRRLSMPRDDK